MLSPVLWPESLKHNAFRTSQLAGIRHDGRYLPLLGQQEPLELPHPQRGVDGQVPLAHDSAFDLLGDRVQAADAIPHCGVSAGNHLGQNAVSIGGRAVLLRELRLPRTKGGHRGSGLFRHRFNPFVVAGWLSDPGFS